jgi:hypothetical protein
MTIIKNITTEWTTVGPLETDEIWQNRSNYTILITFLPVTNLYQGFELTKKKIVNISAGQVVRFKALASGDNITLARETVGSPQIESSTVLMREANGSLTIVSLADAWTPALSRDQAGAIIIEEI